MSRPIRPHRPLRRKDPLLQELAALREDVVPPQGFRFRILQAMAPSDLKPERSLGRIGRSLKSFWFRRTFIPTLGAATLMLGAFFVFLRTSHPAEKILKATAAPQTSSPRMAALPKNIHKRIPPVLHKLHPARPKVQGGIVSLSDERSVSSSVSGVGSIPEVAPQRQSAFHGVPAPGASSSAPNPGLGLGAPAVFTSSQVVPHTGPLVLAPTPGVLGKPLGQNSQIRGNKIVTSRGDYALILFNLGVSGNVRIECYNRLGTLMGVLTDRFYPQGLSELRWTGVDGTGQVLPTGIYLVRIVTPQYTELHKVVVIN